MEERIAKALAHASFELTDGTSGVSARDVIDRAAMNLAKADFPALSQGQAVVKFLATPTGRELYGLSSEPETATLSFSDFLEKKIERRAVEKRRQPVMFQKGSAVAEIAKTAAEIRKLHPTITEAQAMKRAMDLNPALAKQAQAEETPAPITYEPPIRLQKAAQRSHDGPATKELHDRAERLRSQLPGMTEAQALKRVMGTYPDLARRAQAEG